MVCGSASKMSKLIIGYWDIRGLAEPARTLLEYGGVEYEDRRYKCGQEPPYDRKEWLDVKFDLGLDFPNLPYMIDGDLKITESWAILRYIARKIGMSPKTIKEQAECDMLEGVITSVRGGFTGVCYNSEFENKKEGMKESQLKRLQTFEKFLESRKFLTGDNVAHVDFAFFESMDHHRTLFPDFFDKLPNIKDFMERFESLDKIAAYRKSDRFKRFPINNPVAKWGNKYHY